MPSVPKPPKIYLAGPDVFFPDAPAQGAALRALCAEFGFEGMFPLDAPLPDDAPSPAVFARRIFEANLGLIRRADAVLANLQDFRGDEPDSGTAFEVGFAAALGIPVWAYGAPTVPIIDQVPADANGRDAQGYLVEDFGMSRNLMLACAAHVVPGDARACLAQMRAAWPAHGATRASGGGAEDVTRSTAGNTPESTAESTAGQEGKHAHPAR